MESNLGLPRWHDQVSEDSSESTKLAWCSSSDVRWPGWFKALFFQIQQLLAAPKIRGLRPRGLRAIIFIPPRLNPAHPNKEFMQFTPTTQLPFALSAL
eukprot:scaffold9361_cov18-Tisochrysis_lutea.AAC.1